MESMIDFSESFGWLAFAGSRKWILASVSVNDLNASSAVDETWNECRLGRMWNFVNFLLHGFVLQSRLDFDGITSDLTTPIAKIDNSEFQFRNSWGRIFEISTLIRKQFWNSTILQNLKVDGEELSKFRRRFKIRQRFWISTIVRNEFSTPIPKFDCNSTDGRKDGHAG